MKKNLTFYEIIFTITIGFYGCETDAVKDSPIEQQKLSPEMEVFQEQLTAFNASYSSKSLAAKTNQENLFIEASKDLLLANGVSENKVEQLVKQDKSNMVKMAMLTFFENKKSINK